MSEASAPAAATSADVVDFFFFLPDRDDDALGSIVGFSAGDAEADSADAEDVRFLGARCSRPSGRHGKG